VNPIKDYSKTENKINLLYDCLRVEGGIVDFDWCTALLYPYYYHFNAFFLRYKADSFLEYSKEIKRDFPYCFYSFIITLLLLFYHNDIQAIFSYIDEQKLSSYESAINSFEIKDSKDVFKLASRLNLPCLISNKVCTS
jgi:hypothetical protein